MKQDPIDRIHELEAVNRELMLERTKIRNQLADCWTRVSNLKLKVTHLEKQLKNAESLLLR